MGDPIGFMLSCGQDDDRKVGLLADLPTHLETVGPRKHDVEDHNIDRPLAQGLNRRGTIDGMGDRDTLVGEVMRNNRGCRLIVFDEEDSQR